MNKQLIVYGCYPLTEPLYITIDFNNLSIHIENSYRIKSKKIITQVINDLALMRPFHQLQSIGFKRTKFSMIREWYAHNYLYCKGYEIERTEAVDLNQNEPVLRKLGYFFLSFLYKNS